MPTGYQAITFAQLKTRLSARYEGVPFWTTQEAGWAINEALLTWGMLTGRWKGTVVLTTTKNTYELALPSTMTYRMRVLFNGKPLTDASRFEMDHGRPNWRRENTVSAGCPSRPTFWMPVSLQLIYIWPMDAVGHNSWTVDGVTATPTLSADGDFVNLSEADVSTLLGFALHVLTFKKGGQWFAATQPYFQQFVEAAAKENALITTSEWYRRFAGLDPRDLRPLSQQASSVGTLTGGGQ